jgi:cell division protein ZapA
MGSRAVQVRVGGQTYRLVTSASEEELLRLASMVDQKLVATLGPGRPATPQSMLLAAMALAHDLEQERVRAAALAARTRDVFERMVERIDQALGGEVESERVEEEAGGRPR